MVFYHTFGRFKPIYEQVTQPFYLAANMLLENIENTSRFSPFRTLSHSLESEPNFELFCYCLCSSEFHTLYGESFEIGNPGVTCETAPQTTVAKSK